MEIKPYFSAETGNLASHPLLVDSEDNCGYDGSVNNIPSNTEYAPGTSSNKDSDSESFNEYSGDELEQTLNFQQQLLEETAALTRPVPYALISEPKMRKEWKAAEQTQALGYNGYSA